MFKYVFVGPEKWGADFPVANGPRQSPINIVPKEAQYDSTLKSLKLKYDPSNAKGILNNGHSFQVDYEDDANSSILTGGPISGTYRLKQFHFHWGASDDRGSEHTVNGINFTWCTGTLSTPALERQPASLMALQWGGLPQDRCANPRLQKGKQTVFANFDPKTLLPGSLDFWTYDGSLTTPLCWRASAGSSSRSQSVSTQYRCMARFRGLLFTGEGEAPCCMVDNYRPPQPLKGRQVRASFK
ncbi:hypothetical protein F7725_012026 [Dissostichus mawsoni]|uniref:carbonic anhydrase n=1 Tax=Dissostichus mawsoni TaxID=36200 RepID=A0A7J5ZAL5_DISMA|nr:hypothetical protein F7725_012026 [Dissostichus mawsoni]